MQKKQSVFEHCIANNKSLITLANHKLIKIISFRPLILQILDRGSTLKSAVCKILSVTVVRDRGYCESVIGLCAVRKNPSVFDNRIAKK